MTEGEKLNAHLRAVLEQLKDRPGCPAARDLGSAATVVASEALTHQRLNLPGYQIIRRATAFVVATTDDLEIGHYKTLAAAMAAIRHFSAADQRRWHATPSGDDR